MRRAAVLYSYVHSYRGGLRPTALDVDGQRPRSAESVSCRGSSVDSPSVRQASPTTRSRRYTQLARERRSLTCRGHAAETAAAIGGPSLLIPDILCAVADAKSDGELVESLIAMTRGQHDWRRQRVLDGGTSIAAEIHSLAVDALARSATTVPRASKHSGKG